MLQLRRSDERGHADHGWLNAYHSFSFADYYDPANMGFRALRVINEDRVKGGTGFSTHGHRDMEIITYILSGALEHKDSLGSTGVIHPGEVQVMSAGTGVRHSEFNHLHDKTVHLLQIWVLPDAAGHSPRYDQKNFEESLKSGQPVLLVSGDGQNGSLQIHQDVKIYGVRPQAGVQSTWSLDKNRYGWIQVARGQILVNGELAEAGDGVAISDISHVLVEALKDSEYLFFDLN